MNIGHIESVMASIQRKGDDPKALTFLLNMYSKSLLLRHCDEKLVRIKLCTERYHFTRNYLAYENIVHVKNTFHSQSNHHMANFTAL